ncbi:hypothetical protein PLEOSDRAFT_50572 [Pleurotus ostreatus PC15]|uniref:Terpene synthase n=1 Tax=Pleurotus ostreatus (strain PC15) TaxID=1137138 RepID=A0A067NRP6_PLEO1|nr:hypothetical protein PLEOSDRAFT_50572 [Pleurotus ostreatus PC15]
MSMNQEIRRIVNHLLDRCDLPLESTPIDEEFFQTCVEDAAARGFPMEASPGVPSFRPFIMCGVFVACTAYGHLESLSTRMYIALYTSSVTYVDDVYNNQPNLPKAFCHNFIMHLPQETSVLRAFDQLLRETWRHFDGVQANFIIASSMYYMNAVAIEHGIRPLEITPHADKFPLFLRGLSGIACAYCLFTFPMEIHLNSYIQAMPSMIDYINHMNDVLSFYKEEANGEDYNYISIMSKHRGVRKIETLEQLANLVASSYEAANNTLRTSSAAHVAWGRFAQGYVSYHASYARYRLHEVLQVTQNLTS